MSAGARVIVAIGPAAPDSPALIAAAQLARAAGAELAALFVEDINLLRLAELPFALEIGAASATMRRVVASEVEHALKRQAGELRRALAEAVHGTQLDWTFGTVRGRPVRVLLEASVEGDLVVLASSAVRTLAHTELASAMRAALNAISARAKPRWVRAVAVALRPGHGALRALVAAHRLARENATDLVLFFVERGAEGAELLTMVDAWLGERGATARIVPLLDSTPEHVAELVAGEDPAVLFWPGDGVQEFAPEIEALLEAIRCPLIVVR
jgi:hypothetical protein